MCFPEFAVILYAFGNQQRIIAGTGHKVIPGRAHFRGGFNKVPVAVEFEAIRVLHCFTGLHAKHHFVRVGLVLQNIVAVVGHQRRQIKFPTNFQQLGPHTIFDIQAVVHQLQEVIFLAVNVLPHGGGFQRLIKLPQTQTRLHIPRRTPRGSDNPSGVLRNKISIHAGPFTQLPLVRCHRGKVKQVLQPGCGLRDHGLVQISTRCRDVIRFLMRLAPPNTILIEPRFRRQVCLNTDNRFNPLRHHLLVKRVRPEHVAVVGNPHRRHALPFHLGGQHVHLRHTVQHRVLSVVM